MTALIVPGLEHNSLIAGGDVMDSFNSFSVLPRLQINALNSKLTASGGAPPGDWILVSSTSTKPIGKIIDACPLGIRPMAIDMSGKDAVVTFDHQSAYFKEIQAKAAAAASGQLKEYMAGPQVLLLLGDGTLATFFLHNASSLNIYASVKASLMNWVTLQSKQITGKKGSYFAPELSACMAPPTLDSAVTADLPAKVRDFLNPQKLETVQESSEDARPQ